MIEYTVEVYNNGTKCWYLNGEELTEEEFKEFRGGNKEPVNFVGPTRFKTEDNVNNPSHYGQGNIEAIVYIEDTLNDEEFVGYLRGNIAKYLHRWRYKGGVEDLKKAQWYLNRLIETQEG